MFVNPDNNLSVKDFIKSPLAEKIKALKNLIYNFNYSSKGKITVKNHDFTIKNKNTIQVVL